MPHSIFAKFKPVSQRIVSNPAHCPGRLSVDPVLFLPYAACVQSVEVDGLEAIRNLRTSLSSRLRFTGRSVGYDPRQRGSTLTVGRLKAMWPRMLQLSSSQNQVSGSVPYWSNS
jgi:hypothetical protein